MGKLVATFHCGAPGCGAKTYSVELADDGTIGLIRHWKLPSYRTKADGVRRRSYGGREYQPERYFVTFGGENPPDQFLASLRCLKQAHDAGEVVRWDDALGREVVDHGRHGALTVGDVRRAVNQAAKTGRVARIAW